VTNDLAYLPHCQWRRKRFCNISYWRQCYKTYFLSPAISFKLVQS